jgi:hypothetical protein
MAVQLYYHELHVVSLLPAVFALFQSSIGTCEYKISQNAVSFGLVEGPFTSETAL